MAKKVQAQPDKPAQDDQNQSSQTPPTNGAQATNESHTEVHVETHSEQTVTSGSTSDSDSADDQLSALTADLQRTQADFINYRRRAEAEKADAGNFAKARIVREFLTVRDSFDAEAAHRPAGADANWAKSIDAIRAQFDQVLTNLGVTRFQSVGQPFDPHRHEAVATDGGDTVVEELQPGYQMGQTVIRPAVVKVGTKA